MTNMQPISSSLCSHISGAEYVELALVQARMQNWLYEMNCIHSPTASSLPVTFVVTLPPIGLPEP
jgi:hypothetical protein